MQIRSDGGTGLTSPLQPDVKTQNLLREVFDGQPAGTEVFLVPLSCSTEAAMQQLCDKSKTEVLAAAELKQLASDTAL